MNFTKTLAKASRKLAPIATVQTPHGALKLRCTTTKIAGLARTFYASEPETLAWIDQLPRDEALWDIGANIGMISLYAAKAGLSVTAFEPGSDNYAALNENLWINGLGDKVSAYCLALSDRSGVGALQMADRRAGGAHHAFGEAKTFIGAFTPQFSQAVLGLTIDEAVAQFGFPPPRHIKLDVDSIEDKILLGGAEALKSVRSVLIEIESERGPQWRQTIHEILGAAGLTTQDTRPHNVVFSR